jgi:hypothetical protein
MARAGGAYVVRDDDSAGLEPGNVDKLYPYTLKGLTDALEDARFRSFAGPPQVVLVMGETGMRVIRRYEHGRETTAGNAAGLTAPPRPAPPRPAPPRPAPPRGPLAPTPFPRRREE